MPITRFITAGEAVTRVLKSMSLSVPVSVSGSSDSTTALLWFLLGEVGREILDKHSEWQMLDRVMTINTIPGETRYSLPSDFQHFIDETGWNNTARIPLIGPMTTQQWRLLQARQLGGTTLRLQYVIENDEVVFYFAPSDTQEVTISYKGRGWVQDENDPTVYKDNPENDADIVLFDQNLIVAALKDRWRREKGFDTTVSAADYQEKLNFAVMNDRPRNALSISGRSRYPYLGYWNMPDTGYGNGS